MRKLLSSLLCAVLSVCPVHAEISTDGTLGPALELSGPDFQIGAELGQQHGSNLFHSFRDLTIRQKESATFNGPASVDNIISRVTGGKASEINGILRSTIPTADLYLLNPAGIMFGPEAHLDVQGSFHAATADTLKFSDGAQFNAAKPAQSTFSNAPPAAFGFINPAPAALAVDGSKLQSPETKTLSLVGGGITLENAHIRAPAGQLNIAAVGGAGDSLLLPKDLQISAPGGDLVAQNSILSSSGEGGGAVLIRSGRFELRNANVRADTLGKLDGQGIHIQANSLDVLGSAQISASTIGQGTSGDLDIEAADGIRVSGKDSQSFSGIFAEALYSSGNAGSLNIRAANLEVLDGAQVSASTYAQGKSGHLNIEVTGGVRVDGENHRDVSGIFTEAGNISDGEAGSLSIHAADLEVLNGAQISASNFGKGQGGSLSIKATRRVRLSGKNHENLSGIFVQSKGVNSGDAGSLSIRASELEVLDGAHISASTFGKGQGGNLDIETTGKVRVSGENNQTISGIFAQALSGSSGNAGDFSLRTAGLEVLNGGQISASTFGSGHGGNLNIENNGSVRVAGENRRSASGIVAQTLSSGNSGGVGIISNNLEVLDGGIISASTFSSGKGGNIHIKLDGNAKLQGESSQGRRSGILATAEGRGKEAGIAGEITVKARNLELLNGGAISTETTGSGDGGDITLLVDERLKLAGNKPDGFGSYMGAITTGIQPNSGKAGNIRIRSGHLLLQDGGQISTASIGTGGGGNIEVKVKGEFSAIGEDQLQASFVSGLFSNTQSTRKGAGNAGNIAVEAGQVLLKDGARITSVTFGSGNGGDIDVLAHGRLYATGESKQVVTNRPETGNAVFLGETVSSGINASSKGTGSDAGKAGNLVVTANQIELKDKAEIATGSKAADGGNIDLRIHNYLYLQNAAVNTAVKADQGRGGNISISPGFTVLDNGRINANAYEGAGGNVRINSQGFYLFGISPFIPNAVEQYLKTAITATSARGVNGEIQIQIPELQDISGGLTVLPTGFSEPAVLQQIPCALRDNSHNSRLIVRTYAGKRAAPDDWRGGGCMTGVKP